MATGTNVPLPTFGPNGFTVPSTAAIFAGVCADIDAAFGGNLNFALNTPQGQLASSMTLVIQNVYQLFQYYTQQTDPAYASGRMQDAIGRIYNIERDPAEPTVLQVACTGALNLVLTAGTSLIRDEAGNIYALESNITLGSAPVTGSFACTIPGPVSVPSGENPISIYSAISGWDAVALLSGVEGVNTESRQAFEARRQDSVAGNSMGAIGSIIGAVSKVPGVIDYFPINNSSASPLTTGGVTVPAYSIYIAVSGGAPDAIGQAIFSKKGPGAPTFGNTIVTAFDSNPLYAQPIPYPIAFQIPTPLQLIWAVQLVPSSAIPANAVSLVQNALVAAVTQGVISSAAQFVGQVNGSTLTVSSLTFGSLSIGQILVDTTGSLSPNTQITGLGTGAGGIGTYTISPSQTVGAETMSAITTVSQIATSLRARIGQTIYATNYVQAISALGAWAQVASIFVGSANVTGALFIGTIAGTALTVSSLTSGTIAIGQTLFDTTGVIATGTTILSGSGTSWVVSISQTVGGASFTGSASAIGLVATGVTGVVNIGDTVIGTGIPANTTIIAQISGTPGGAGTYLTSAATTASSASITTSAGASFTGSASNLGLTVTSVTGVIVAGQIISGTGITSGTTIVEQLSGTAGGAGTYLTSLVSTASAATITTLETISASVATQSSVAILANQEPQQAAINIAVGVV